MVRVIRMTVVADKSESDQLHGILRDARSRVREAFPTFAIVNVERASETTATFTLEARDGVDAWRQS